VWVESQNPVKRGKSKNEQHLLKADRPGFEIGRRGVGSGQKETVDSENYLEDELYFLLLNYYVYRHRRHTAAGVHSGYGIAAP
jgi:hypothetical protein